MRTFTKPFWVLLAVVVLGGCGLIDAVFDRATVEVTNSLSRDFGGVAIKSDGVFQFKLDPPFTKSFKVDAGTHIITASHPNFETDPMFRLKIEAGATAKLVLSTRRILGYDIPWFNCTNCDYQG